MEHLIAISVHNRIPNKIRIIDLESIRYSKAFFETPLVVSPPQQLLNLIFFIINNFNKFSF